LPNLLRQEGVSGRKPVPLPRRCSKTAPGRSLQFRSYNIRSRPARLIPGRRNPYVQFLESVKDKLVSLGFEEFDGSLVETEFWNGDALFMPQFHSARDIHDVYYVAEPTKAKSIEEPYLSRVAAVHENGGNIGFQGLELRL
jgi:phenylalanyl-tRNA synthetase alpha chain